MEEIWYSVTNQGELTLKDDQDESENENENKTKADLSGITVGIDKFVSTALENTQAFVKMLVTEIMTGRLILKISASKNRELKTQRK